MSVTLLHTTAQYYYAQPLLSYLSPSNKLCQGAKLSRSPETSKSREFRSSVNRPCSTGAYVVQ